MSAPKIQNPPSETMLTQNGCPPFTEYEEPPTPCPWNEYETTKEIYEQAVFIILARGSNLSVYPMWKECVKV
jgi:hypothetical protein